MGKDKRTFNPSLRTSTLKGCDIEELWRRLSKLEEEVLELRLEYRSTKKAWQKYYSRLAFTMFLVGVAIGVIVGIVLS